MYDYYYNVLRQYFVEYEKVHLLNADTDSFVLKIRSEDIFSDLKCLSPTLDFSNLPPNHYLFDATKKSKLFHFKEEFGLLPILRFVSLGSKVYAIQTVCCNDFNLQVHCKCSANICNNIDTKNQHNLSCTDKLTLKGVSKLSKNSLHLKISYFAYRIKERKDLLTLEYNLNVSNYLLISFKKLHYPVSRTKDSFLIVESTLPLFLLIIAVDVMKMSATDVFIILM